MKYLYSFLLLLLSQIPFAQNTEECGTPPLSGKEREMLPHYNNNRFLVDFLNNAGYAVPKDYFELIDERGLYKGRKLRLRDLRKDRNTDEGNNSSGRSESWDYNTVYYVGVKFWVYWDMNGSAATQDMIDSVLFETQSLFRNNGFNVELYYKQDPEWIFSSYADISGDAEFNDMVAEYRLNSALNIHVVREAPWGGRARAGKNWLAVQRNDYSDRVGSYATLAHEIGHNYKLEHTHHGESCNDEDNELCFGCVQESVSRSRTQESYCNNTGSLKCEINGDLLCDTQASYADLKTDVADCEYNPILVTTDKWGDPWNPDVDNIMSYSDRDCRKDFTLGQIGVALTTLTEDNDLDFYTTSSNTTISGSTVLCPNQSYTFSVPNYSGARGYHWEVVPDHFEITSGQGTRTVTVTTSNHPWDAYSIYCTPLLAGQKTAKKDVEINPLDLTVYGSSQIPADGVAYPFSTDSYGTTYSWTVPSGWTITSGQGTAYVNIKAGPGASPGYINVSSTNCGMPMAGSKYVSVGSGRGPQARYDEILSAGNYEITLENVHIYDISGQLLDRCMMEVSPDGPNINGYPAGLYIVKYNKNNEVKTHKILKK